MNFFPNWYLVAGALILVIASIAVLVAARGPQRARGSRAKQWRHLVVALALLVIAARPTVGNVLTTTYTSGADVVFMIDRTTSMGALDYDGAKPRMDGVRGDVKSLVTSLSGSRFAVIVFDNNARVALPFTTDASAVVSLVEALDWRFAEYGTGSDIAIGMGEAQQLLGESHEQHPELDRYLYYFGDGEQTRDEAPQSMEPLRAYLTGAEVFGYGSAEGARMLVSATSTDMVQDERGEPAISHMEEENLAAMAEQLGGGYRHRTGPTELEVQIRNPTLIPVTQRDPRGFEVYWIAGLIVAGILAWGLWEDAEVLRRARRQWR